MKVRELINALSKGGIDQNAEVVLSKDGEGNDHSPLADVEIGWYVADSAWSGWTYYSEETREEVPEGVPAVIFWPVN